MKQKTSFDVARKRLIKLGFIPLCAFDPVINGQVLVRREYFSFYESRAELVGVADKKGKLWIGG
jgi:hypothetical protein